LIAKRVGLVKEGLEKEWESWKEERKKGEEEVSNLKRQAEELSKELPVDEEEMKDVSN
jgi:predicted  nucleic acid-binding Zn-ribbon protein